MGGTCFDRVRWCACSTRTRLHPNAIKDLSPSASSKNCVQETHEWWVAAVVDVREAARLFDRTTTVLPLTSGAEDPLLLCANLVVALSFTLPTNASGGEDR